ncbi:AMIN-like domain-containing (lipo)protein [Nonomuraea soli]|uniref:AMIN-like domain-containing protein n=1 Tax=Nonomuraea soli TaxID=1032476 RepID=A0A7W0CJU7_9ACTN|nr:hypothetical protein [Nonomuraea soli]MBA2892458.1 hypothetical protein [Nonomuraea soli]
MRPSHATTALIGLLLLAGCGGTGPGETSAGVSPGSQEPTSQTTGQSTTGQSTAAPSPASPAPTITNTKAVQVDRDGEPAIVTGVRHAAHPGFDRVVIDFKGEVPGYTVEWQDELTEDGSGEKIDVPGVYLHVRLTPANAHDDDGKPTWVGGPIYQADLGNVRNVVRTGDFEAHVGVGIVLDRTAPFQVKAYDDPARLVIDIAS